MPKMAFHEAWKISEIVCFATKIFRKHYFTRASPTTLVFGDSGLAPSFA